MLNMIFGLKSETEVKLRMNYWEVVSKNVNIYSENFSLGQSWNVEQ